MSNAGFAGGSQRTVRRCGTPAHGSDGRRFGAAEQVAMGKASCPTSIAQRDLSDFVALQNLK